MGATIITSQWFFVSSVVATKPANRDNAVPACPVVPVYTEVDRTDDLGAYLLDAGDIEGYLAHHAEGEYFDPMTWEPIF